MVIDKRVVLFENSGRDFLSARLSLARYLLKKGYIVYAFVPDDEDLTELRKIGLIVLTYRFNRSNKGFLQLLTIAYQLCRLLKKERIDIIHSFRFQPNLINSLAGLFSSSKRISHITGLGITFSVASKRYKILRQLSQFLYTFIFLLSDSVVFQNDDDEKVLIASKYFKRKIKIIYGSGVDLQDFCPSHNKVFLREKHLFKQTDVIFIVTTRLLREKGVYELVSAFKILTVKFPDVRLLIIGGLDKDNPRSVDIDFINSVSCDRINFIGRVDQVRDYLELADIYIYPSYYREGIPRSILEAMAMKLPIITTNMPGCRNTVINFYNGLLIRPRSINSIANVCERIILSQNRNIMGVNSRLLVEEYFSNIIVFKQIENLYK